MRLSGLIFFLVVSAVGSALWAEEIHPYSYYSTQNVSKDQIPKQTADSIQPMDRDAFYRSDNTYFRGGIAAALNGTQRVGARVAKKALAAGNDVKVDKSISCIDSSNTKDIKTIEKDVEKLRIEMLCSADFNAEIWDKETPPYKGLNNKELSLTQAKRYLQRFAKNGGFKEEDHHFILTAILVDKETVRLLQKELFFALQMIFLSGESSQMQSLLKSVAVDDLVPKPPYNEDDACRSEKEILAVREKSITYARNVMPLIPNDASLRGQDWLGTMLLIPSLNAGPPELKLEVKNKMYRTLGSGALSEYPGLFLSKALMFTKSYVNKLFGDPAKELTEFTAAGNSNGKIDYYILGTSEMSLNGKSSIQGQYGIQTIPVIGPKPPELEKPKITEVAWTHQGKPYTAQMKIASKKSDAAVAKGKSPDYDKMWENKKMSGVVLVSDNLGDFKAKATNHYIQYYAEQGFNFDEPVNLKDSEAWLKDHISDGTVDYVLKDAHSGGNTSNLISFSKSQKLLKGTKELPNGKKEEIYILAPGSEADGPQQTLSYDSMGEWMKKREQSKQGPMVYLNSSCWSMDQAKYEIPAVHSSLFVNIPATSKTTTFINSKEGTKYHIIEGLREGKTYEQMRKGMATTKRYQTGTNQYKFPDQQEYQDAFSKLTEIQVEIKDGKGKPYSLEEAGR